MRFEGKLVFALIGTLLLGACTADAEPAAKVVTPNAAKHQPGDDPGSSASEETPPGDSETDVIWPNATSSANSDPWLSEHHDEITRLEPRTLIINFANGPSLADVTERWNAMSEAMSESSRFHGYDTPSAKPFVVHKLVKLVDLADRPVPSGWKAPNSTKMPRKGGGFDFAKFYGDDFADHIAISDPKDGSRKMGLCELVQRGFINELFIAFNKTGSDDNVPEIIEYKQMYDANDKAIAGKFDPQAGNGTFEPADLPEARACGRSLRVDFIEMTGTLSGALHVLNHNMEHLGTAVPNFKRFFYPLLNYDLNTRFDVEFQDWYGISVNRADDDFLTYDGDNSVTWKCPKGSGCEGKSGTLTPFDQGCGNTHYAPNSRNSYDMHHEHAVLTRCAHYGLQDGPGGKDVQTPYSFATIEKLAQKYGDDGNGGGWQVYLLQNFPNYKTKAKLPDGTPMKNFWPYLYY